MPDPIKSAHSVFQQHMKRMEARNPTPALSQAEIFARAIAEGKNPGAVYLSSLGASKGGKARAKSLSAERRSEIARKAGKNRWKNRKD
jgi:hypothetical protein